MQRQNAKFLFKKQKFCPPVAQSQFEYTETDVEQEQMRDVYLTVPAQPRPWSPVITHLVVPGLPKGAQVEIQPLACSEEGVKPDSNDDSDSSNSTKSPSSR